MRTCFFLGAGASAEFGYPTTRKILPLIRSGLREGNLFGSRNKGAALRARLKKFLGQLFPGFPQAPEEGLPSIVDVLSLDHSLRSSTTPIRLLPAPELTALRTLLEVAICEVIRPEQKGNKASADRFWAWVKSKNDHQKDSIGLISTNYDTSVDRLIFDELRFKDMSRKVDIGVSWRDPDEELPYPRPSEPWLRFYKLHGSLNWLRCDMCEHMYLNYLYDIYFRVLDDKVSDVNSCHCGHGKLSLMLVTPSYVRDVREPNLLSIWRNALELLRTSNSWVIVGLSLVKMLHGEKAFEISDNQEGEAGAAKQAIGM